MSAIVSASGLKRSPARFAFDTSVRCVAEYSGVTIQSGSSIHSPTPAAHEPLGRHPDDLRVARDASALVEQLLERDRVAGRVVEAVELLLGRRDDPVGEVANVDELHRLVGRGRREHAATLGDASRPVREAVRRIVRADDQPRPDDERALAEGVHDDLLARRLQRAVVLDVLRVAVVELRHRCALDRRRAQVGVGGDARDVDVATDAARESLDRAAHDAREEGGDVEHGVPLAAFERRQVERPVAADLLGLREELRVRLAAVEEGQLVAARERRLDERATEEACAAEDEEAHAFILHEVEVSIRRSGVSAAARTTYGRPMAEKLLVILWAFATAWLVARVSSLVARRVLLWNDDRHWAGGADLADQMANIKRRETLVSVFRGAVAYLAFAAAAVLTVAQLSGGVDRLAAIAGASFLLILVGFSIQRLLTDIIAGLTMFIERWYSVGDSIAIPGLELQGVVEDLSLRRTKLRALTGEVIHVHNSQIQAVRVLPSGVRELTMHVFVTEPEVARATRQSRRPPDAGRADDLREASVGLRLRGARRRHVPARPARRRSHEAASGSPKGTSPACSRSALRTA